MRSRSPVIGIAPRQPRRLALLLGSVLLLAVAMLASRLAGDGELLHAVLEDGVNFSLSGESRENVVGGELSLGDRVFTVTGVSRMGLIGASRLVHEANDGPVMFGEYAVFSSSFSDQTAVGTPWPKAREYHRCEQAYNSFLALYRVDGASAVEGLGKTPYPTLTENPERADGSVVYCFMSRPPETTAGQ